MYRKTSFKFLIFSIILIISSSILIAFQIEKFIEKKQADDLFKSKEEFIEVISDGAKDGYHKYNILPSVTIAQAILESNWGYSDLSKKGKNLFGIKSTNNFKKSVTFYTYEYYHGQKVKIKSDFRAYNTYDDSISDHNILLGESKRYKRVRQSKDYKECANALYNCGYSTDPNYPQKLISIIEKYKLYEYDY